MVICGAVSAEDGSNNGGELELEGEPISLEVDEDNSQTAKDEDNGSQSGELVDPIIGVKVNYQYADDEINPGITLKNLSDESIEFVKTYDAAFKGYKLEFLYPGAEQGSKFKVSVTAPGYITQEQVATVNKHPTDTNDPNLYANLTFNMKATENYRLGREVTKKADELLNFATADEVLCITTAGVPKINGTTGEDIIEGILNQSNGIITDGKGNLLIMRKTPVDPVNFAFAVKRGSQLTMAYFYDGSLEPAYVGTASANMSDNQWIDVNHKLGKDAYDITSMINAWAVGAPTDLLKAAAFHGHMCDGTISGYAITEVLLKYFPPIQETLTHAGAPADHTFYRAITIPGDSKDDAFLYILNLTPGKGGSLSGYDTSQTGANRQMAAFIRWDNSLRTGTLIILNFDREAYQRDFKEETGQSPSSTTPHDHSHDDLTQEHVHTDIYPLRLTTWLLGKLNENPEQYIDIILAKEGLSEESYYYLLGAPRDIVRDGEVVIPAQEAAGLDLDYIKSLDLPDAIPAQPTQRPTGNLTPGQMKQIGIDAANLAKQIFHNEKGINLEKDDRDLLVQTSAGYVRLNGQLTDMAMDGIFEVLGSRLSRYTLLPMHTSPWKPLYFTFTLRGADGITMDSIYMSYDPDEHKFWVGTSEDGNQVNDIGPEALNDQERLDDLSGNVFKEGNWFNIQSIANAWRNDPPFDQLLTFLFHDHACPGVQPGFFITERVLSEFPLSGDEYYSYLAASIYCKDDSLVYLMGISPGQGTYMSNRLTREELFDQNPGLPGGTDEGLLVIWDPATKTGQAVVITFKWPQFDRSGLTTNEARREMQISGFVSLYKNEEFARLTAPVEIATSTPKYISEAEYRTILQGGFAQTSAIQYLNSLPYRNRADLIQVPGGDHGHNGGHSHDGTGGHTHDGTGGHTHDGTGGHTHGPGGHVHGPGTVGHSHAHAGYSPGHTHAASELGADGAEGESPGEGTAYEVTAGSGEGGASSNLPNYALIFGLLGISALAVFGFLKGGFGPLRK